QARGQSPHGLARALERGILARPHQRHPLLELVADLLERLALHLVDGQPRQIDLLAPLVGHRHLAEDGHVLAQVHPVPAHHRVRLRRLHLRLGDGLHEQVRERGLLAGPLAEGVEVRQRPVHAQLHRAVDGGVIGGAPGPERDLPERREASPAQREVGHEIECIRVADGMTNADILGHQPIAPLAKPGGSMTSSRPTSLLPVVIIGAVSIAAAMFVGCKSDSDKSGTGGSNAGTGGDSNSGGSPGTGGSISTGGSVGTGGSGTGGATGGSAGTGGKGTGGAGGTGGASGGSGGATGGSGGAGTGGATGGSSGTGGATGGSP